MIARAFLALALVLGSFAADAEQGRRHGGGREGERQERQMSREERQRMREDVREAYRDRGERPQRAQQMTPEERGRLRRDIENVNKDLRR